RLAELERRAAVLVDEGCLHRRLFGAKLLDHAGEPVVDRHQPLSQRRLVAGRDRAAGDEDQPVAVNVDHAPAGAAKAGIDTENANRAAHDGPLIAPPQAAGKGGRPAGPCRRDELPSAPPMFPAPPRHNRTRSSIALDGRTAAPRSLLAPATR